MKVKKYVQGDYIPCRVSIQFAGKTKLNAKKHTQLVDALVGAMDSADKKSSSFINNFTITRTRYPASSDWIQPLHVEFMADKDVGMKNLGKLLDKAMPLLLTALEKAWEEDGIFIASLYGEVCLRTKRATMPKGE